MSSPERMSVDTHSGTLRINGITMSDEGNYACTINTVGHPPVVSSNAHLYVESTINILYYVVPYKDDISLVFNDVAVVAHSSAISSLCSTPFYAAKCFYNTHTCTHSQ